MKEDTKKQFQELEDEANKIKTQYYELLEKRRDAFRTRDMGCICDGNCRLVLPNETIRSGEQHNYCHDDADYAFVYVECINGNITAITYAAVWWTWNEQERRTLGPGGRWYTRIHEQDEWYDQSNRVQIVANADSTYYLSLRSVDR